MTWRLEYSEELDKSIEDEIRRELDLVDIHDDLLDLQDGSTVASSNASAHSGDQFDSMVQVASPDAVDDVIEQYALRLEQHTSVREKELLECDELLENVKYYVNGNAVHPSWRKGSHHSEGNGLPESGVVAGIAGTVASFTDGVDDNDDGSISECELAIEWYPSNHKVAADGSQQHQPAQETAFKQLALVPVQADITAASSEGSHLLSAGELVMHQEHRDQESTVHRVAAVTRARYKEIASRNTLDREELKMKRLAVESKVAKDRNERITSLHQQADALRKQTEEQEVLLLHQLQEENLKHSTYAAEMQEHIRQIDIALQREKADLQNAILANTSRQQQTRCRAAITLQSAYRGYRVRKVHSGTLHMRLCVKKEAAMALRVQVIEAERHAAKAEALRQQAEAEEKLRLETERQRARKQAEELQLQREMAEQARKKAEEEHKRKIAEEVERRKAEDEHRRKEAEELARQKAEEKCKKKAAKRLARQAEERLAQERKAEDERLRCAAAAAAAELAAKQAAQELEKKAETDKEHQKDASAAAPSPVKGEELWSKPGKGSEGEEDAERSVVVGKSRYRDDAKTQQAIDKCTLRERSAELNGTVGPPMKEGAYKHKDKQLMASPHPNNSGACSKQTSAVQVMVGNEGGTLPGQDAALPRALGDVAKGARDAHVHDIADHARSAEAGNRSLLDTTGVVPAIAVEAKGDSGLQTPITTTGLLSASDSPRSAVHSPSSAAANARRAEERLAEMQSLKARMEMKQSRASVDHGAQAGAGASATAPDPLLPVGAATSNYDISFISSKLEERRMRWMKDCTPWSSIEFEVKNKKAGAPPRKAPARKASAADRSAAEVLPEKYLLEAAGDAVTSLKQVQAVQLTDLPGYSLSPLSKCANLKAAAVRRCALTSVDDICNGACASSLIYLDCQDNAIDQLPQASFGCLTTLNLSSNHVTSMAGLEMCTGLRFLNLARNKLTRIAGLGHISRLHSLDLSYNQLISTKGVGEATTLQVLDVSYNNLSTVDDLDKLCLLESLAAQGNNIRELPRLPNGVLLRVLQFSDNSISTLGSLAHSWLPSLKHLDVSQNSLSALVPLHGCPLLQHIDLRHNQLVDSRNLADAVKFCVNLKEILLEGTPVACHVDYRARLQFQLPRVKMVDGVAMNTEATDIHVNDFLKACELRCQGSAMLHQESVEHSMILASQKLSGGDLLTRCLAHVGCLERSSLYARNTRNMHEYGELSDAGDTLCGAKVHSGDGEGVVAQPCTGDAFATSAQGEMGQLLASSSANADSLGKARLSVVSQNAVPGASGCNNGVAVDYRRARIGHGDEPNAASGSCNEDEIAAVSVANMSSRHTLAKVATLAGSREMIPKAVLAKAAAATTESKEAFEQRLRMALESTSQRLLQSEGFPSFSADERASHLTQQLGSSLKVHKPADVPLQHSGALASTPAGILAKDNPTPAYLTRQEVAATRIQAVWRGHTLRKRLASALRHARTDLSTDEDFSDYGEVDVSTFDTDQALLDENWLPPQTPQLPKSYASLPGQLPADVLTINSHAAREPHPPLQPKHAWRNLSAAGQGGATASEWEQAVAAGRDAPTPTLSTGLSHRSGLSRKEDLLAEEWGFKDHRTAELIVQRAKKLKYDAIKKKKLGSLDPKQKLAFLRRLEESAGAPAVRVPAKRPSLKKEYFEAMEAEAHRRQLERRAEDVAKEQRMYEWVHTQVGSYDLEDESPVAGRRQALPAEALPHARHHDVMGFQQETLPYIERHVIQSGRAQLVASPLDVQSVDSREQQVQQQHKRLSEADVVKENMQLPPIKTNSAPSSNSKRERISFRDNKVDLGPGWGSGRKRNSQR